MPKKPKKQKASPAFDATTASILVRVYDGTRNLLPGGIELLIRVRDGNNREVHAKFFKTSSVRFDRLQVFNNFGDDYTVIVSAKRYAQAGFRPVHVSPKYVRTVELMLLPMKAQYDFTAAAWGQLGQTYPMLVELLRHGSKSDAEAQGRYVELTQKQPDSLASLLNLTTAMTSIQLPNSNPLSYFKELIWDKEDGEFTRLRPDRFYAYADRALIDQVKMAADQGLFSVEQGAGVFHPGATNSFKHKQLGEANVQLTFHEEHTKKIDGVDCVMVEPDIDYYKDPLSHAFLEVVPNTVTRGVTDPKVVYMLRWIAGRQTGLPPFEPPYTVV